MIDRPLDGWVWIANLPLRSSASRRESTSSGRLQKSSHIYFWKENLKLDRSLRVVWTGCWNVQTDASWNRSFSIQRSVRTEKPHRPDRDALVWRSFRRYDTSSGRLGTMNRRASGRDDTSSERLAGNRNLWLANSAESSEALLNSRIPVKSATLHRSDFVQQNATNTKTNKLPIWPLWDKNHLTD
jgi:hypothetical protein